ncbi:arsenical pump-driving ATPase [Branchiibius cervicis]|uniref:Arsenical pump-driving ATPase n=1 Tax=Branchiibius cervicis TaxID=908252 RepID=A0ABW2AX90_9MICO
MTSFPYLTELPRFVFFTGKGGVGKTSLACATAVTLADQGRRVLLVSTDPASNVGQVFGLTVGDQITAVPQAPGLDALEIDPNEAAEAYREKIIAPVRDVLPQTALDSITEQLSGSCTTEIASFNEFTTYLADDERIAGYDHVVFDTAPTGHTIRLLQLPGEWTSFLDAGKGDASCLGPMAGLDRTRAVYADAVRRLANPAQTRLVLVARAQQSTLREAARTSTELATIGITEQHLVINALLPAGDVGEADALADAVREREHRAIAAMPEALRRLPLTTVPLRARTVVGIDAVRALLRTDAAEVVDGIEDEQPVDLGSLATLIDEIATTDHGLIMCMGKGGVGKTTVAAAIAIALADRGHTVHLTTTDPAAHLDEVLDHEVVGNLTVSRIDPHVATQEYRDKVLASKGNQLDEAGRARLVEDLLSPCTEEVAVFGQFSHLVNRARRQFVVMDTAPTGHTLLLMDATGSYHRDIARSMGETGTYTTPLMRLRDPDLTKVIIVTLPDTTPVLEATELQDDLQRAGIHPWAWVVNASLAAARPTSPLLRARAAAEHQQLERITELARRTAIIPMLAEEPYGPDALRHLTTSTRQPV